MTSVSKLNPHAAVFIPGASVLPTPDSKEEDLSEYEQLLKLSDGSGDSIETTLTFVHRMSELATQYFKRGNETLVPQVIALHNRCKQLLKPLLKKYVENSRPDKSLKLPDDQEKLLKFLSNWRIHFSRIFNRRYHYTPESVKSLNKT